MELFRRFAQGGIVLFDEIPSDLILREIIARRATSARLSGDRGSWILLSSALVLVLLRKAAIGRHCACCFGGRGRQLSTSRTSEGG
jgi:hypothetical protein